MTEPDREDSPVSHFVTVSNLPDRGLVVEAKADAHELAALADVHDIISAEAFGYDLRLTPWKGRGVRIRGRISASVEQSCTVTLEPLTTLVDEEIDVLMVPEDSRLARPRMVDGELQLSVEGDDPPETFADGRIDVGALAEEFFSLALPLYPRKEGVELPSAASEAADDGDDVRENPFAALSVLKKPN